MSVILGGGLSGLASGYYMLRNNLSKLNTITLLESSNRCGGWIESVKTPYYLFEQGPRTIRPHGPNGINTLNLIEGLGLSNAISPITTDRPAAKNRMIYAKNRLHSLPNSANFSSLFLTREPFSKPLFFALLKDLFWPKKTLQDDSIYNFALRRFGKDIADYAVSSMVCGICAGDAKEISVKFLMSNLFEMEQKHGGVVKGFFKSINNKTEKAEVEKTETAARATAESWSVYTLNGGLQVLPNALEDYLIKNGVNVQTQTTVDQIHFENSKAQVHFKDATDSIQKLDAEHIFSSIPANRLGHLVSGQHPELAENLLKIPFVSTCLVNLYYENKDLIKNPGFGFLIPPIENSPILGVIYDSCCLPDQHGTVLTVMMGGRWFKERLGENPNSNDLLDIAKKQINKILNISDEPKSYSTAILKDCIPQYIVGHHDRVDRIRKYIKDNDLPISLVGASYDGIGVNDVISSAKSGVESIKDRHDLTLDMYS